MSASDDSLVPPRLRPYQRFLVVLSIVAAIAISIWFLRRAKTTNAMPIHQPLPSIEAVREPVQRAIDPEAKGISGVGVDATFAELRAMKRPDLLEEDRPATANLRIAPLEKQVWRFTATVTEVQLRRDKDLYLVIEAEGLRGCVELPDPDLCKGSPFYSRIASLRSRLDQELKPTMTPAKIGRKAILTGIGFFGTAGKNDNGARLMPLLDLKWTG
jgi:hypothetical protein